MCLIMCYNSKLRECLVMKAVDFLFITGIEIFKNDVDFDISHVYEILTVLYIRMCETCTPI